jgi:hypothetical protein
MTVTLYELHDGWADQFTLGSAQSMDDARIVAQAAVNRMVDPSVGQWIIRIKEDGLVTEFASNTSFMK